MEAPTVTIGKITATLIRPSPLAALACARSTVQAESMQFAEALALGAGALACCWPPDVAWPVRQRPRPWKASQSMVDYGHGVFDALAEVVDLGELLRAGGTAAQWAGSSLLREREVVEAAGFSEAPRGRWWRPRVFPRPPRGLDAPQPPSLPRVRAAAVLVAGADDLGAGNLRGGPAGPRRRGAARPQEAVMARVTIGRVSVTVDPRLQAVIERTLKEASLITVRELEEAATKIGQAAKDASPVRSGRFKAAWVWGVRLVSADMIEGYVENDVVSPKGVHYARYIRAPWPSRAMVYKKILIRPGKEEGKVLAEKLAKELIRQV